MSRNFKNPWPRLALIAILAIWSGANLWSGIFRRAEIMDADRANQSVGLILTICFALLPLVVAIYLLWTVVVGPDDPVATGQSRQGKRRNGKQSTGKNNTTGRKN